MSWYGDPLKTLTRDITFSDQIMVLFDKHKHDLDYIKHPYGFTIPQEGFPPFKGSRNPIECFEYWQI